MTAPNGEPVVPESRITVLHVEDDPGFADLTADMLERQDERIEVHTAHDAAAGRELLAERAVDCVVSDYEMPGDNGIEFLRTVRERDAALPFVLFTGKGSEEVASDAVSAGVTDYLQKEGNVDQYAILANRIVNAVEKARAETDLQRRSAQYEAVADLGRMALEGTSHEALCEAAVERIADGLDNEYAKALELNDEGTSLLLVAGVGWNPGLVGTETVGADRGSQAGYTLAASHPVVVDDLRSETRFHGPDLLTDHGVVSGISVIVGSVEDPWGVLGTHTTEHRSFTAQDVTFVETVANVLAAAIERRETEKQLRESESQFRRIAELSPDGIFRTDTDGRFRYVSPASEELLEQSAAEIEGTNFERYLTEESLPEAVDGFRSVLDGDVVYRLELTLVDATGATFEVELSASPIRDEESDEVIGVQGFARDVTEQRERERELRRSRARYETLVEHFPNGGVFLFDENLEYTVAGGAELEEVGLTTEMMRGRRPDQVFPPENAELLVESYRTALEGVESSFVDTFQGQTYHVQIIPLWDEEGNVDGGMSVSQNITERTVRERELQRYERIVEAVGDAVYALDDEGRIVEVNEAMTRLTGYGREELLGEHVSLLLDDDDIAIGEATIRELLEGDGDEVGTYEETIHRADGGKVRCSVTQTLLPAEDGQFRGTVGTIRDVTDRWERALELERYETVVEALGDPVYAIDADGCYTFVNDAFTSMAGYDESELLGEHTSIIIPESDVEKGIELTRNLLRSGGEHTETCEMEVVTADGDQIPCENHVALLPFDEDGQFRGTAGVVRDVTDRLARERELERQNERLDEFASVVSHDLRNPLSVARGELTLAREECDSDHLAAVERSHERMRALIEDLLTVARRRSDAVEVEATPLETVASAAWRHVRAESATLDVETDRTVLADGNRLQQLLENLFRNAVEHGSTTSREPGDGSEQDSPSVDGGAGRDGATRTPVTVTVSYDDGVLSVADDGPGIPEDERDRVFESGYTTTSEGTGFGLRIVSQIAEAHGWTVTATESHDGGARFDVVGVTEAE